MEFLPLTNCERLVMECVWTASEDISLIEIMDMLKKRYAKEWKRQTISTFLTHLIEKKYVETYRNGRVFYYKPVIPEKDYKDYDAKQFVDSWYRGEADVFLSALKNARGLTDKEVNNVQKLINELA